METIPLAILLRENADLFHPVVPFLPGKDKLLALDFTAANHELTSTILQDTKSFTQYITQQLNHAGARYGIGGYGEHRTVYSRSKLFGSSEISGNHRGDGSMNRWGRTTTITSWYRYMGQTTYSCNGPVEWDRQ